MSNNQLTEEEQQELQKYERRKAQDRARQRTYYAKNKANILEKRKVANAKKKETLNSALSKLAISTPVEENVVLQIEEEKEEEEETVVGPNSNYTQDEIISLIKNDKTFKTPQTQKTYITDVKRLFKITKCQDLKNCVNAYKKMITNIENSKEYSINTIKQTIQIVLFINDKYNLFQNMFSKKKADELKKHFTKSLDKFKDKSMKQTEQRQYDIIYPSFKELFSKAKSKFGQKSKEYLIVLLYSQFTVRDNFNKLKIISDENEDDGENNFLLKTTKVLKFIINDFKTAGKFQQLHYTVPKGELYTLINWWIDNKKLAYGSYLFGKTKMSSFISKTNESLGYKLGGVNLYRHARITDLYKDKNISFEQRNKLSNEMGHGMMTQEKYRRNLTVNGESI
jgi:hypothetical protein